ncbi:hypothetical protein C8N40_111137 [Pontibacter mucosus]|uniref:Uncharacterized protein n=1 Tax=Pontibacter mucosus TaxID=1649266 RepID=A0A2T5YD76_9BACT|nr:hypothetical protein [Pontibacter mucosus]PTX14472.1 hypothetical protein C8N40_111137 [Pontibacter mucosus]
MSPLTKLAELLKTGTEKSSVPNIVLWTIFLLVFIYYGRGIQGIAQTAAKETSPEEMAAKREERETTKQLVEELRNLNHRLTIFEQLYNERFGTINHRLNNVEEEQKIIRENYVRKR